MAGGFAQGMWVAGMALAAAFFAPDRAQAQNTMSGCAMVSEAPSPLIRLAALKPGAGEVAITFVGHSTFVIESPGGVRAATDYNDHVRPSFAPDIATMNRAHSTHFTNRPDPAIRHVLRGWSQTVGPAVHDLTEGDMRVRNVATNIRSYGEATDYHGNSIFIFETAGLCLAHLGHLHHTLSAEKLAELGKVDVLFVPVDGSWTMDQDGMIEVLDAIRAPLVVPMHFFSGASLERFIRRLEGRYAVRRMEKGEAIVSRDSLPAEPTILVLPGRHF